MESSSRFEHITVIPLYIGIVRIYDSELDHTWDEQVSFSLSYAKTLQEVRAALNGGFPDTASAQGIIRHYHIKPNGDLCFIQWEGDVK